MPKYTEMITNFRHSLIIELPGVGLYPLASGIFFCGAYFIL
jgi:hypothetical protein